MPVNIIPQPAPLSQLDVTWPALDRTIAEGGAFVQGANPRFGPSSSTVYTLWSALGGTGGSTVMSRRHNNEIITGRWRNAAGLTAERSTDGFPICCPLTVQSWPAAYRDPEHIRVWRQSWLMAWDPNAGGNPTEASGVAFIVSAGTVGGWVTAAANTGAFGIAGDGAGGWNFFAKQGAATYVTTALTWPNAITELTKVEFQLIAADGRGAASLGLFINDAAVTLPAAQASWGAGSALPDMSHGSVANSNKLVAVVRNGDAATEDLHIAAMRCIAGHFTADGTERS